MDIRGDKQPAPCSHHIVGLRGILCFCREEPPGYDPSGNFHNIYERMLPAYCPKCSGRAESSAIGRLHWRWRCSPAVHNRLLFKDNQELQQKVALGIFHPRISVIGRGYGTCHKYRAPQIIGMRNQIEGISYRALGKFHNHHIVAVPLRH